MSDVDHLEGLTTSPRVSARERAAAVRADRVLERLAAGPNAHDCALVAQMLRRSPQDAEKALAALYHRLLKERP